MSLVYFALWVIFHGRITLEILIAGAVISLLLDQFVKHILGITLSGAAFWKCIKLLPDAVFYVIVLLIGIVKANAAIIKTILAPNINIEPCLVNFHTTLKTNAARIVLANSITLTSGTITVSHDGSDFLVHALNKGIAEKLNANIFERLLSRMERIANA